MCEERYNFIKNFSNSNEIKTTDIFSEHISEAKLFFSSKVPKLFFSSKVPKILSFQVND